MLLPVLMAVLMAVLMRLLLLFFGGGIAVVVVVMVVVVVESAARDRTSGVGEMREHHHMSMVEKPRKVIENPLSTAKSLGRRT